MLFVLDVFFVVPEEENVDLVLNHVIHFEHDQYDDDYKLVSYDLDLSHDELLKDVHHLHAKNIYNHFFDFLETKSLDFAEIGTKKLGLTHDFN